MYLVDNLLCDRVAFRRQLIDLIDGNAFRSRLCNAVDSLNSLRMFNRAPDHRAHDGLSRYDSFQMTRATTRAFRPVLLDLHMTDLASGTGSAVVNLTVDDKSSTDSPPKPNIEYNTLT